MTDEFDTFTNVSILLGGQEFLTPLASAVFGKIILAVKS